MNKVLQNLYRIVLCLTIIIGLKSCANIMAPTGGPKDVEAPTLVKANPKNATANFVGNTITLQFSEDIQLKDPNQQILVNPSLTKEIETSVKKNKYVVVKFQEELLANTTYTINFREAVKDLTESNTATDLQYSFSTGNIIDSCKIKGTVKDLFKNTPVEKVVIALYQLDDTSIVTKHKPKYLTKSKTDGSFEIRNIKKGNYNVYAFLDNNSNSIYDNDNEVIDYEYNVAIDSSKQFNFELSKIINKETELKLAKNINSKQFNLVFSHGIKELSIVNSNNKTFNYQIDSKGKSLIVYNNTQEYNDSIPVTVAYTDSLERKYDTIVKIVFVKAEEKKPIKKEKEKFLITTQPANWKINPEHWKLTLSFSRPITTGTTEQFKIKRDSLPLILKKTEQLNYEWNKEKTSLNILGKIAFKDSIVIELPKGSWINILGDSSTKEKIVLSKIKEEDYASFSGTINTTESNYIIEVLNEKYELIDSQTSTKKFDFKNLLPGKYYLRAIIDSNNNGKWDQANLTLKTQAEKVVFYKETVTLKANWEINDVQFSF